MALRTEPTGLSRTDEDMCQKNGRGLGLGLGLGTKVCLAVSRSLRHVPGKRARVRARVRVRGKRLSGCIKVIETCVSGKRARLRCYVLLSSYEILLAVPVVALQAKTCRNISMNTYMCKETSAAGVSFWNKDCRDIEIISVRQTGTAK